MSGSSSSLKRKVLSNLGSSSTSPAVRKPRVDRSASGSTTNAKQMMQKLDLLHLTWLGTSAGSPSRTRNVSSSALRVDGDMWLIDAGEATQHQLQQSKIKVSSISKIFLTHMHGDHSFGLVPLMCALAEGAGGVVAGSDPRDAQAVTSTPLEIYGLTGLRQLIRTTLNCTYTHLARRYRVHELLFERDRPYGGYRHRQELEGRDIWIDREKGCWPNFINEGEKMRVSAAPIQHTVPCVGFVFEEAPRLGKIDPKPLIPLLQKNKAALALPPWNLDNPMMVLGLLQQSPNPITLPDGAVIQPPALNTNGRKLVILGDTCDAESTTMDELAKDADLVVHESTNAFLPGLDDALKDDDTYESIEKKTKSHGHSTPQIAGRFAKRVNAKSLFMNHFSNRYIDAGSTLTAEAGKADQPFDLSETIQVLDLGVDRSREYPTGMAGEKDRRINILRKIEDQATEAWASGQRAVATRDLMTIAIKRRTG